MAESRGVHIKCHRKKIRLLLLHDLKHDIQEAIHRIRMKPLAVRKIRYAVKSPVQDTVSVYQYKFLPHLNSMPFHVKIPVKILHHALRPASAAHTAVPKPLPQLKPEHDTQRYDDRRSHRRLQTKQRIQQHPAYPDLMQCAAQFYKKLIL